MNPIKITRIPTLKSVEQFREYVASLGIDLQADDSILTGAESPLNQPLQWFNFYDYWHLPEQD